MMMLFHVEQQWHIYRIIDDCVIYVKKIKLTKYNNNNNKNTKLKVLTMPRKELYRKKKLRKKGIESFILYLIVNPFGDGFSINQYQFDLLFFLWWIKIDGTIKFEAKKKM